MNDAEMEFGFDLSPMYYLVLTKKACHNCLLSNCENTLIQSIVINISRKESILFGNLLVIVYIVNFNSQLAREYSPILVTLWIIDHDDVLPIVYCKLYIIDHDDVLPIVYCKLYVYVVP